MDKINLKETLEGQFISDCLKVITSKINEPKYKSLKKKGGISDLYKKVGLALFACAIVTNTIMQTMTIPPMEKIKKKVHKKNGANNRTKK